MTSGCVFVHTQGNHSVRQKHRLKRPETTTKRRTTALNFTVFCGNTPARFTSRFLARRLPSFSTPIFVVLPADVKRRRNTSVFAVLHCLRLLTALFSLTWVDATHLVIKLYWLTLSSCKKKSRLRKYLILTVSLTFIQHCLWVIYLVKLEY